VVFIYNGILFSHKEESNFCFSQVNGWNWRASSYIKLERFRKPKVTCSPSYVEYRPKANTAIL
jgi:hypothetical protein